LEDVDIDGVILKWFLNGWGVDIWAGYRVQWWALLNMVMNHPVP
jgi:endonuclease/exonuclease/phosphatase (EEP) superfamily protein YafD